VLEHGVQKADILSQFVRFIGCLLIDNVVFGWCGFHEEERAAPSWQIQSQGGSQLAQSRQSLLVGKNVWAWILGFGSWLLVCRLLQGCRSSQ
jgi:hypothetical protein